MVREATPIKRIQGNVGDVGREPQEVSGGSQGSGGGNKDGYRDRDGDGATEPIQLTESGGVNPAGFPGRPIGRVSNMEYGGPDTQARWWLLQNRTHGSGMEDGGGDHQPLPQRGHHPPWCNKWVTGRSRDRDRLHQGQTASAVYIHEGEGPVWNISGPERGL